MNEQVAAGLQQPERTVKSRTRQYKRLPVMAIVGNVTLTEDGEVGTVVDLLSVLPGMRPTLFAKVGSADFVAQLNYKFKVDQPDAWQWRISNHERELIRPDGSVAAARVSVIVHYFGWKNGNYHKIIDPVVMYGHKLDTVWPGDKDPIVRLLHWSVAVRDFCDNSGVDVRPTTGGISAQFLTDPRFYPGKRRKVPARTNSRSREYMPGNHYHLNIVPKPGRDYCAHYLDQRRAHHYHARTLRLPDSNHLYAYGRFCDLAEPVFRNTTPGFHGLYCLDLEKGTSGRRAFGWIGNELTKRFVFSNELPHILDMGYTVTGVRAAWGSRHLDTGLAKYAQWAESQLDRHSDAGWIKPLLLSAYGVLATKPKYAESVFRLAKRGDPVTVRTGKNQLDGTHTKGAHKLEPRIANVIHRGMIEAATRSESIGLAQHLNSSGHRLLSIYADAVIVEVDDDNPLPALPEPWRLKRTLNHLEFINQQAFRSDGMTKLPGVSRDIIPYRQRTIGRAPEKIMYDALSGQPVHTGRRI